jgi:hypothetical protein
MIRAYDKLGMFDLRDDTQRVFQKNYPNSHFLGGKGSGDAPGGSSGRSRGRSRRRRMLCSKEKRLLMQAFCCRLVVPAEAGTHVRLRIRLSLK